MQNQFRVASKRSQLGHAVIIVKQTAFVYLVSNSSLVRVFGHLQRFSTTSISMTTFLVKGEEIFSGFFSNATLSIFTMAVGVTVWLSAIFLVLIGW
jgi:hypothetical protein